MRIRTLVTVGGTLVVAMLTVSAWAWPQLPADAPVPVHWGPSGEPDGYGPKWVGLLGLPAVALGIIGLLAAIPRIEPRRANLERSGTAYVAIGLVVVAFLGALHVLAVLAALGGETDITTVAIIGSGVVLVVIGNFLGKTRSNWFFGVRTPWTLSSERSWTRTHRLGGFVFIGSGVLVMIAGIVLGGEGAVWVLLGTLGIGIVVLVVYSYLVWRDDPARHSTEVAR